MEQRKIMFVTENDLNTMYFAILFLIDSQLQYTMIVKSIILVLLSEASPIVNFNSTGASIKRCL